ncbi:hypothetical protein ABEO75_12675 [Paenibacillus macerans]|uniref:hypothetical protein n=1 Tax=Paenibacillus macerans TaxID=44252 RepID=UPI003D2A703A
MRGDVTRRVAGEPGAAWRCMALHGATRCCPGEPGAGATWRIPAQRAAGSSPTLHGRTGSCPGNPEKTAQPGAARWEPGAGATWRCPAEPGATQRCMALPGVARCARSKPALPTLSQPDRSRSVPVTGRVMHRFSG